jgi:hypothetical protein
MVTRRNGGVDVVFRVPLWSERWVLEDGVTMPETSEHRLTCELLEGIGIMGRWRPGPRCQPLT